MNPFDTDDNFADDTFRLNAAFFELFAYRTVCFVVKSCIAHSIK